MGNLGTREKYGMFALVIVLILFLIYIFGIRNLDSKYETYEARKAELEQQKEYYDALKADNDATSKEIQEVKKEIEEMEATFLPEIRTEAIENFLLDTFKKNNCPYLVKVETEDINAPTVVLPDGTTASDMLVWKRVTITYSTTDGFNVPQYNHENTVIVDGTPDPDQFLEKLATMYDLSTAVGVGFPNQWGIVGYEGFVKTLKEIEAIDSEAIKIFDIKAEDQGGYMLLTAQIDFYSATFNNRLSKPDETPAYVTYPSAKSGSIKIGHGFIGLPYYVSDSQSAWYKIMVPDSVAAATTKPFATYYSNALFSTLVKGQGLARTIGIMEVNPIDPSTIPTVPADLAQQMANQQADNGDAGEE